MMDILLYLLIFINILVPVFCAIRNCVKSEGMEINHIFLFSFGYLYYWIFPIIVGKLGLFEQTDFLQGWHNIYNSIYEPYVLYYLLITIFWYIAYYYGSLSYRKFKDTKVKKSSKKKSITFSTTSLNVILGVLILVLLYFIYRFFGAFFKGYGSEGRLDPFKGSFVALSLCMLSLSMINYLKKTEISFIDLNLKYIFTDYFFLTYLITSVLILSLGSRLYFLSGIIILIVFLTTYKRKIKWSYFIIFSTIIIVAMGLIGAIRFGDLNISLENIFSNLVDESMFTSFSLVAFLKAGKFLSIISFPKFLISDFINLIPRFILPTKESLFLNPANYGYVIYSPLGALNSFVSFSINFGILGTAIVLFFLSALLNYFKTNTGIYQKIAYISLSGWLAYTFFRDPFSTSVVKNMFEFSVLVPFLFIAFAHILTIVIKRIGQKFSNMIKKDE